MTDNINKVEETIQRMAAVVRQQVARDTARSFGETIDPETRPLGWWVLACGESYSGESMEQREQAREALLAETRKLGLSLPEYVWVWDDTNTAQLVVGTVPSLERARKLAGRLREKGLVIRVRREKM